MIQTIDIPKLPLTNHSTKKILTRDDPFSMWNVYSKREQSIKNAKRLENFSWRLWHHELFRHRQHEDTRSPSLKVSPVTTILPSSVLITSSLSSHSTFGPQTPPPINLNYGGELVYRHSLLDLNHSPPLQQQQQPHGRCTNKFFVEDSDDEAEEENDDTFGQSESLWSTVHDDHYFEEAYQRNQPHPVSSPLPRKENPGIHAAPLDFSSPPAPATNQKQPFSLLSRLIQSAPSPTTTPSSMNDQQNSYDILPPQLQSCVEWEKAQNSIRYRLGCTLDLPNEHTIW